MTDIEKKQEVITDPSAQGERTFTQSEVDRMITKRLSSFADYEELKEKAAKYDEAEEANKSELQKAIDRANALQSQLDDIQQRDTVRQLREDVAHETGVPASLLTATTREECEAQAKAIADYKAQSAPTAYPAVKDGGDPQMTTKKATRDQFADWLNSQS